MMTLHPTLKTVSGVLALILLAQQAQAAIALDRTRVVFNGSQRSTTLTISNQNTTLPYLAQAWIEDAEGTK
ncbi:TPA: fimbria/pilus periplasmic chaperone, partial [Citrobacter farmeri]